MDEKTELTATIMIAMTSTMFHLRALTTSRQEAALVCRALTFAFEESDHVKSSAELVERGLAMQALIDVEVDQLLARRKEQRDRESQG